jgi:hypothetical protein
MEMMLSGDPKEEFLFTSPAPPPYYTKENYRLAHLTKQDAVKEVGEYEFIDNGDISGIKEAALRKLLQQVDNYIINMRESDEFDLWLHLHTPFKQILGFNDDELLETLTYYASYEADDDTLYFNNCITIYGELKRFNDSGMTARNYRNKLYKYEKARDTAQKYSSEKIYLDLFPAHPQTLLYEFLSVRPKKSEANSRLIIEEILKKIGMKYEYKKIRLTKGTTDDINFAEQKKEFLEKCNLETPNEK